MAPEEVLESEKRVGEEYNLELNTSLNCEG